MKAAVRYFTRSGNTEKLARAIAEAIGVEAKPVSEPLEEHTEILFLGSSVYAAGMDSSVKDFVVDNQNKIGKIYNFSTAALLTSTYKQMKKLCEQCGVDLSELEFHCRGSFGPMHKGRPNEQDLEAVRAFAKRICR
jgi:flavodoxin